jgi:hypothetical protein
MSETTAKRAALKPVAADAAEKMTTADRLVILGDQLFTFGRSDTGDLFALPKDGPNIARPLRGSGMSVRAELARTYVDRTGKAPTSSALADAMLVAEGRAQVQEETELFLRVAPEDDGVALDLGRADGFVAHVTPKGWKMTPARTAPLFTRTKLTRELPIPERDGNVTALRELVNVSDETWPLLLGWLVAALVPGIPHPIAFLTGEQGTGKSTAGRMLVNLADPSSVPLRASPRDEQAWGVAAAGSWVVGLDNLSHVAPWLSDAMCRAVTGDGMISRQLYTDAELSVLRFRRVLLLTSIDAGALRGDLADRMVPIELQPITEDRRRSDQELAAAYEAAHPRILGGLLTLLCDVLAALPVAREKLTKRPRMADYAEILCALDMVTGGDALPRYLHSRTQLAEDVIDSDLVASAVRDFARSAGTWTGTAATLLELLQVPDPRPKSWPMTAHALSGRINRAATALGQTGVIVQGRKSNGKRLLTIRFQG